jgi:signal transduction histidine kinase
MGVLQVSSYRYDAYSEGNMRALEALAPQVAAATANASLYQQAQNEIAERVRAEEALQAYSEQLEDMVAERTRALQDAQAQLIRQERLAVLGQLAGAMAHGLRNPLGAIRNVTYLLNMVIESPRPEIKESLAVLEQEVATAEEVIRGVLDFAQPRSTHLVEVNLNDIIQTVLIQIALPEEPGIEVVRELDPALPDTQGDPEQLGQAFGNIVLNAVQSMSLRPLEDGDQRLTIRTVVSPGESLAGPRWVMATFTDTGPGIPEENLEAIFEPLFTTKAKGIGLGLTLARSLVEGHGGTVGVESQVGVGSTFTVRLPASGEPG